MAPYVDKDFAVADGSRYMGQPAAQHNEYRSRPSGDNRRRASYEKRRGPSNEYRRERGASNDFNRGPSVETTSTGPSYATERPMQPKRFLSYGSEAPYAEHGIGVDRARTADMKKPAGRQLAWPRIRRVMREPFSEFMGTFILVLLGDGSVAQVKLSNDADGNYQSISWGWGLGVMLGVYTAGISGAHINPAVTFANCMFRGFPWRKFPIYASAQVLGAFCASGVVYANYKSAIDVFEGGPNIRTTPDVSPTASAGIFCTYPQSFMTTTGMFFDEFIASTILMFLLYALKDDANVGAGNLTPLGLFFIVFAIGACFGWETGYAINLARDFGPRVMSYFVGYGDAVFKAYNYYFWIPMIAPFCGCVFGGFLYDMLLFTGQSPINSPYLGFYRFVPGWRPDVHDMEPWTRATSKKNSEV